LEIITTTVQKKIVQAEYAKDGAYVRVKSGDVEDRMEIKKRGIIAVAQLVLERMVADGKI
jgi:hypothetical protein